MLSSHQWQIRWLWSWLWRLYSQCMWRLEGVGSVPLRDIFMHSASLKARLFFFLTEQFSFSDFVFLC